MPRGNAFVEPRNHQVAADLGSVRSDGNRELDPSRRHVAQRHRVVGSGRAGPGLLVHGARVGGGPAGAGAVAAAADSAAARRSVYDQPMVGHCMAAASCSPFRRHAGHMGSRFRTDPDDRAVDREQALDRAAGSTHAVQRVPRGEPTPASVDADRHGDACRADVQSDPRALRRDRVPRVLLP